jgi:hypothetical protein
MLVFGFWLSDIGMLLATDYRHLYSSALCWHNTAEICLSFSDAKTLAADGNPRDFIE